MSSELIVDPSALKSFADKTLQSHLDTLARVSGDLHAIATSSFSGHLFGDFPEAYKVNSRAKQLLTEMTAHMGTALNSLVALQNVATEASAFYAASDSLSAESIKSINANLDSVEAAPTTVGKL